MATMKFYVETFGCQMNVADSQEMSRHLLARGLSPTQKPEEADWILINTCTVRDHAEHKALSYLGRLAPWKSEAPRRRIVLAGCAAERMKDKVQSRFPQVDLVVGAKSIDRFNDLLEEYMTSAPFNGRAEMQTAWPAHTIDSLLPDESVTATVTIMRGCNYNCSYCIVPAVRGRESYRPLESIIEEVRQKAALGLSEIMLVGQTVNSYKPAPSDGVAPDFADLLRAVNAVPGVRHIRFMSPHPFYLNDRMIDAMAESGNVCRHLHLPSQSGSDQMLKRMRRNYTRQSYLERLEKLRRAMPDIAVSTDLIVGFPGETDEDFRQTLSFVKAADFHGAYCFKYSPRPGTESAGFADALPEPVIEERHAELLALCESLSLQKIQAFQGTTQTVLIERLDGDTYEGHTEAARKIFFTSPEKHRPGETVLVAVTETSGRTLKGVEKVEENGLLRKTGSQ